jgi:hypothetical protein
MILRTLTSSWTSLSSDTNVEQSIADVEMKLELVDHQLELVDHQRLAVKVFTMSSMGHNPELQYGMQDSIPLPMIGQVLAMCELGRDVRTMSRSTARCASWDGQVVFVKVLMALLHQDRDTWNKRSRDDSCIWNKVLRMYITLLLACDRSSRSW